MNTLTKRVGIPGRLMAYGCQYNFMFPGSIGKVDGRAHKAYLHRILSADMRLHANTAEGEDESGLYQRDER